LLFAANPIIMRYAFLLLLLLFSCSINIFGQEFKKSINKDSLFLASINDLPQNKKAEALKLYNEGNEASKEFFLIILSMPRSSKKELTSNIDSNFNKIIVLKNSYLRLVPKGYIVSIEFNPAGKVTTEEESIDLMIEHTDNIGTDVKQEWRLAYDAPKLNEMVKPLNWTNETIQSIKKLLADANCVSIKNGEITTIGFARSGMGKYSFKLFDIDLTKEEISHYNNGCMYIFYKKNIVLEYGGGAIGPQCFPDDK
jgi:hypothetical protein